MRQLFSAPIFQYQDKFHYRNLFVCAISVVGWLAKHSMFVEITKTEAKSTGKVISNDIAVECSGHQRKSIFSAAIIIDSGWLWILVVLHQTKYTSIFKFFFLFFLFA